MNLILINHRFNGIVVDTWAENIINDTFDDLHRNLQIIIPTITLEEEGVITTVFNGIAKVSGIPDVGYEELIEFPGSLFGIAFNLEPEEVGVVLLGDHSHLKAGDRVQRTCRVMDVPVGEGLLGRVIDPLGKPLDGKGTLEFEKRLPIERKAPSIMDRAAVTTPLQTGIKIIDAVIPIGRGQRELILGDRQSGKTAIAVDAIINQKERDVICVYCAIGQRASAVAKVLADLTKTGALSHSVLVVSEGDDAAGLNYLAPYAATSIAEYFMEQGKDVLIVYDDLSKHAWAYREISLLLRRPPGREAFPGDIFYIHSRLLERSTHLKAELGGGSLTALPIIETEAQDLSAYIPTNLISITDGQIYLSPTLFELGVLPAIDIGKSVSRVGDKAQLPVYHSATGKLKLEYAQFKELESFARFGTRLDEKTRDILNHGQIIVEILKQPQSRPMSVPEQIVILLALNKHLLDKLPLDKIGEVEEKLIAGVSEIPAEMINSFYSGDKLSAESEKVILEKCNRIISLFTAENLDDGHARES